jgi:hypothetical protein
MQLTVSDMLERPDEVAAQRSQLAILRDEVRRSATTVVTSAVQLGARNLLHRCDICEYGLLCHANAI